MSINIKQLTKAANIIKPLLQRYGVFILVLSSFVVIGFLVYKIDYYSTRPPSEDLITEKTNEASIPKIDEKDVQIIRDLQDSNIQVEALFNQARNNPFNE